MPASIRVGTVMTANTIHSSPLLQSYSLFAIATIYTHYSYIITGFTITAHHNRVFRAELYTKVYSCSVAPPPPEVARRRKILRSTFLHTSKSHSVAPGMHAYSAHELRAKMHVVMSALQLFTLQFLSWWLSQSISNKLK